MPPSRRRAPQPHRPKLSQLQRTNLELARLITINMGDQAAKIPMPKKGHEAGQHFTKEQTLQQQTNRDLARRILINSTRQAGKLPARLRKERTTVEIKPAPNIELIPNYEKERAEFIVRQGLTEAILTRMENAFRQAYKKTRNIDTITQEITRHANVTYAKAYAFAGWALANKWQELTSQ